MTTYLVRIDATYFEGASRLECELAVDRMSHWLAANLDREHRVRVTLVETFNEAGVFLVERDGCRKLEEMPAGLEQAISLALAYAIETWTGAPSVEIEVHP